MFFPPNKMQVVVLPVMESERVVLVRYTRPFVDEKMMTFLDTTNNDIAPPGELEHQKGEDREDEVELGNHA